MRIHTPLRLLAALATIVSAAAAPAAAQIEARGVVFAVGQDENGEGVLEPVTILVRDGFLEPLPDPSESTQRAFNARWLNAGRTYDVLRHGERAGTIAVRTPDEPACTGLTARGRLSVRPAPGPRWQALAVTGVPPQDGAPWMRDVTPAEKGELDRMAAALFAAYGIDARERTRADTATAALLVHPNARPVLVGSYGATADEPVLRKAALLVVAEERDDGYRPAYAWFHEGVDAAVESRDVVDAADLDGDGLPELVVRNGYYEHWDFTILRRTEHGWMPVYRGGGGGC